ncbi:hypothetical protein [Sorangium sp. So ce362]|uniref:hypothetical protein n=1 Tax=Sorangium sp. So ce362 TaxID=3133303 RepID=UPI003F63F623
MMELRCPVRSATQASLRPFASATVMKVERVSWARTCWRSSESSKSSGRSMPASWR